MTLTQTHPDVVRFHGHECPGASLGARIADAAVRRLGRHAPGNELIAIGEIDSCALDAVQVIAGCTFGKRNLVHRDHGKNVFTFWRKADGAAVRVSARPGSDAYRDERTWELAEKVEAGTADDAEKALFARLQAQRIERILTVDEDALLLVQDVDDAVPSVKSLRPHEACEECGDQTSVSVLHNHRGRMLCPPCHLGAHGGELPADHGHGHHGHGHGHGHHGHDHSHPRAHAHAHGHGS